MTEYQIPITYVVSASAITPQAGLEPLKLSTILLLTDEEPVQTMTDSYMITRTASAAVNAFGSSSEVAAQVNAIFSQQPNILANNGYVIIAPFNNTPASGDDPAVNETLSAAITRLSNEIYFEGILTTRTVLDAEYEAAAATVEAMQNRILMVPISEVADLSNLAVSLASYKYTRPVMYLTGDTAADRAKNARKFAAAYLSRGLAVNYSGSNTTLTMNLKTLSGIVADTQISETILENARTAGVDCYPSIEGLAKVQSFKHGNMYFDQVTNLIWFVNTIQREVFNVLATTGTKVPQTEPGLEFIRNAIRAVCNQAVVNGYIAPGTWNSSDTFGDYEDFFRNIEEFGYYEYHQPVAEQSQSERELRQAPVWQIAAKESGAVHSANILIYVEA